MQDWASSVSRQAWSKPLPGQSRDNLIEPMEFGENEDIETSCWGCFPKKRSLVYSKVKSF